MDVLLRVSGVCKVDYPNGTRCSPPSHLLLWGPPSHCREPPSTLLLRLETALFATSQTLPRSPCLVSCQGLFVHFFSIPAASILIQGIKFSEAPVVA